MSLALAVVAVTVALTALHPAPQGPRAGDPAPDVDRPVTRQPPPAATPGPAAPPDPAATPAATPAPVARFEPVALEALPGWTEDPLDGDAWAALAHSCRVLSAWAADRPVGPRRADGTGTVGGTAGDWHGACAALLDLRPGDAAALRGWLRQHLRAWAIRRAPPVDEAPPDPPEIGLFTGYYIPSLTASFTRQGRFQTPILGLPPGHVTVPLGRFRAEWEGTTLAGRVVDGTVVPLPSRAEIRGGALDGGPGGEAAPVLAWTDDPIGLFFVEIQGSGILDLTDGRQLQIAYAGTNGQRYFAIGRALIDQGHLSREAVSLQSIRAWLEAHPDQAPAVMDLNPSYVFFRLEQDLAATGALGVPLTPLRSIAVDRRLLPLGAPLWLDVPHPLADQAPLRRLMVGQDVGGAVRGAVRGDVFWGYGPEAELPAGRMRSRGRAWLLLPRALDPR